ncbi:hypothetical protein TNCV_5017481 [Trichonephila clavipes]|nr:hypothetical protein TNCV_5017481 [Trichonephila clavipes]
MEFDGDRNDQKTVSRLLSGHFNCMTFESGRKVFQTCSSAYCRLPLNITWIQLRFDSFEVQEAKLAERLINTTNGRRLVQGHETNPLRVNYWHEGRTCFHEKTQLISTVSSNELLTDTTDVTKAINGLESEEYMLQDGGSNRFLTVHCVTVVPTAARIPATDTVR